MSTDGSGNYTLPEAPIENGQVADATVVQSNFDDLAAGMTERLTKNGKTTATANLPMGNFRHTAVGAAVARTDYARADQVIGSVLDYAADTGTATAFAIAPTPGISAYVVGQRFAFKANNANSGADPTLAVNSLTAGIIYNPDGTSLAAGDIANNSQTVVQVASVTTGTPTFHLQSPPSGAVKKAGAQTITGAKTFTAPLGMSGAAINEAHGANIASAATIDLDAATGNVVDVTGTTSVTAITLADGAERTVRTTGILVWTNGASLVLPTAANITSAAGDYWTFRGYAAGVVRMTGHQLANGRALAVNLSSLTNSLGADVNLTNSATFFDGPKVAQGTAGTWLATGNVSVLPVTYGDEFEVRLDDGTAIIARTGGVWQADGGAITTLMSFSLSGVLTTPAGDLRLSVRSSNTGAKILQTVFGNTKASTITAVRIG
jgi:hypothetical protein